MYPDSLFSALSATNSLFDSSILSDGKCYCPTMPIVTRQFGTATCCGEARGNGDIDLFAVRFIIFVCRFREVVDFLSAAGKARQVFTTVCWIYRPMCAKGHWWLMDSAYCKCQINYTAVTFFLFWLYFGSRQFSVASLYQYHLWWHHTEYYIRRNLPLNPPSLQLFPWLFCLLSTSKTSVWASHSAYTIKSSVQSWSFKFAIIILMNMFFLF